MIKMFSFRKSTAIIIFLLIMPFPLICQNNNPFKNMKDQYMIETLKKFPDKFNRWNVPASDGRVLYELIMKNNYKQVVEVGTSNGYSALWMGFALKETGGKLITIEINEERAMEARQNIREAGLDDVIEVRINDAIHELDNISPGVDFVFLDADKSQYAQYFRKLNPKLNPGGAIAAHNVLTMEYAMRDFLNTINNDPEYTTKTFKQSRQGILVGYKKKKKTNQ